MFFVGSYSAGMLSLELKSGFTSDRVVHIRTYPTPPHIMHLDDVAFVFLNLDVPNFLVLNVPVPWHASHTESYFLTMRAICGEMRDARREESR